MYYDFVRFPIPPAGSRKVRPARPAVYAVDSYTNPYPAVVAPVVLASAVMTPVALVSVALTPSSRAASKSLSRYPNPARPSRMTHIARNASGRHGYMPVSIQFPVSHTRDAPRATEPQAEPLSQRHNAAAAAKSGVSLSIHTHGSHIFDKNNESYRITNTPCKKRIGFRRLRPERRTAATGFTSTASATESTINRIDSTGKYTFRIKNRRKFCKYENCCYFCDPKTSGTPK